MLVCVMLWLALWCGDYGSNFFLAWTIKNNHNNNSIVSLSQRARRKVKL